MAPAKVRLLLDAARHPFSLDAPLQHDDESGDFGALVSDWPPRRQKRRRFGTISPTRSRSGSRRSTRANARCCGFWFGLSTDHEQTLAEVARRLSLSRERVRQIEQRALAKLRFHAA